VCVSGNTHPWKLYIKRGDLPSQTDYDKKLVTSSAGGCLTVNATDLPPLNPGRYYIGVFNPSATVQNVTIHVTVDLDLAGIQPIKYDGIGPIPIADDAVSYSSLFVTNFEKIADIEVGLRIDHPRVSGLRLHSVSPSGTRVLLCENRGGLSTKRHGRRHAHY